MSALAQLTDAELEQLGHRGFFVRDAVVDSRTVEHLAQLSARIDFQSAAIRRSRVEDRTVRSDDIAWLDDTPLHPLFEELRTALNRSAYLGLTRFDVQLAKYREGGLYHRHLDAFPGGDNRRVTAIVYLNSSWTPEHGGLLRLHLEPPVDIAPQAGRLVVFLSARVEHEVLEVHAPRLAVTAWFYGPHP